MPDIIQQAGTVSALFVTVSPPPLTAKAGSYYCCHPRVCCQLYCGEFSSSQPQQENKAVSEREITFMENTVKANQTQKGEQSEIKQNKTLLCYIFFSD